MASQVPVNILRDSQIDKLLRIFRSATKDPSPAAAYILQQTADSLVLNLTFNQRSLDRGKFVKFQTNNIVNLNTSEVQTFLPVDVSSELLTAVSKSTNLKAVVREIQPEKNSGKKHQHLEIWQKSNILSTLDLTSLDVHRDVYCDGEFGSLEWSSCENKLLYIAETKLNKTEPFYKITPQESGNNKDSESSEKKTSKGEEYLYQQDWGEALVGKKYPVIVVCDIVTEKLQVLDGVPDDLSPGQVTWAPDGGVVGIGWRHEPRKLGLLHCTNRISFVFHLTTSGQFNILSSTKEDLSVRSPRFSPDGSHLLWLERPAFGPHHAAHRLVKFDWKTQVSTILVDIVQDRITISEGDQFYGLYCTALPRRCFVSPNEVVISTPQMFVVKSYIVNTDSKTITEIPVKAVGSLSVLDVFGDSIICAETCMRYPWEIKLTRYIGGEITDLSTIKSTALIPGLEWFQIDYLRLQGDEKDDFIDYSAVYLGPTYVAKSETVPLVLIPHGGPHSTFADSYSSTCALFAMMGYAVLLVNFRGSIGQGQRSVDFLPGRVGDTDVKDCYNAMIKAFEMYPYLDPDNVSLFGGSHGGFLSAHLSGQYPTAYKAVVTINPVIDMCAMLFVTDIPDWAIVEAGITTNYRIGSEVDLTPDQLTKMCYVSPTRYFHQVKAPTLILLGQKDLRVPMSQGLLYYNTLKGFKVKTKVLCYEDNHSLSNVPVEIDCILNSALWILEHTNRSV